MRRLLATLALPAVLFTAGCGSDSSTNPTGSPVGTYNLYTINASSLPYTFPASMTPGYTVTALSGTLTLNNDNSYSENTTVRITPTGGQTSTTNDSYSGTWVRNGNGITTNDTQGGSASYTWDGKNQLTYVDQGVTIVYRK